MVYYGRRPELGLVHQSPGIPSRSFPPTKKHSGVPGPGDLVCQNHPTLLIQEAMMSLHDPFKAQAPPEAAQSPPSPSSETPGCGWLLPLPEDAHPRTKREKCGDEAPYKIRVVDYASDVEVNVCPRHKGEHDEIAAQLRAKGKSPYRTMRRKAS